MQIQNRYPGRIKQTPNETNDILTNKAVKINKKWESNTPWFSSGDTRGDCWNGACTARPKSRHYPFQLAPASAAGTNVPKPVGVIRAQRYKVSKVWPMRTRANISRQEYLIHSQWVQSHWQKKRKWEPSEWEHAEGSCWPAHAIDNRITEKINNLRKRNTLQRQFGGLRQFWSGQQFGELVAGDACRQEKHWARDPQLEVHLFRYGTVLILATARQLSNVGTEIPPCFYRYYPPSSSW